MIAAANVVPAFHHRRQLVAEDLRRLQEPCVLFEYEGRDSDGALFFAYTVAGVLDGVRLEDGCTVAGEVMLVHADNRQEADDIASMGLMDTMTALDGENERYLDAQVALARLQSVSPLVRVEQALKPDSDKSDAFIADIDAIRPLIGDDIVLAAGRVES